MSTIDIRDFLDIEDQDSKSTYIKSSRQELCSHQVYLDEDIGEPKKYRDLINLLYTCSEDTEFNFFINTCGGSLSSAMSIIEAIKNTNGTVRAIITGEAHSAGSIIALSCHEIIVTDSAQMMVHTASYGTGGNVQNVQSHVDFSTKHINKILDKTYSGFLSPAEFVTLRQGVELWFDSDDIVARLKLRQAFLKKQTDDSAKPEKKARKRSPVASVSNPTQ
jgi:ATP-dependent protease ClpP protease subunit